jgi:hypothetical protein
MATAERPIVFFDIEIAGSPVGRVIFTLFSDLVPKTAENFRQPFFFLIKYRNIQFKKQGLSALERKASEMLESHFTIKDPGSIE